MNLPYRIERVTKLVMTPGLVNEILTGMARGDGLGSAFAAQDHVNVPASELLVYRRRRWIFEF